MRSAEEKLGILEQQLRRANGRRRERTLNFNNVLYCMGEAISRALYGIYWTGYRVRGDKWHPTTTMCLAFFDDKTKTLKVGVAEGPAYLASPGRTWKELQPWRDDRVGVEKRLEKLRNWNAVEFTMREIRYIFANSRFLEEYKRREEYQRILKQDQRQAEKQSAIHQRQIAIHQRQLKKQQKEKEQAARRARKLWEQRKDQYLPRPMRRIELDDYYSHPQREESYSIRPIEIDETLTYGPVEITEATRAPLDFADSLVEDILDEVQPRYLELD